MCCPRKLPPSSWLQCPSKIRKSLKNSQFRNTANINGSSVENIPSHAIHSRLQWDAVSPIGFFHYLLGMVSGNAFIPEAASRQHCRNRLRAHALQSCPPAKLLSDPVRFPTKVGVFLTCAAQHTSCGWLQSP